MRGPVESAAVDNQPADRIAVAADILGRRIDDDRRSVLERPGEDRRRRVVNDERDAEAAADFGDLGDGKHREFRIGQRFGIVSAGALVGRAAEIIGIDGIDKADFDALILQRIGKQIPCSAVQIGRADDVVAGAREVLQSERRRGLSRRQRQRADATLHRRHALLQHIVGRIHDARIDIAEFLEREQVRGVLGIAELIRRGLIDRYGNGTGRRVRTPAGVKRKGFRMLC